MFALNKGAHNGKVLHHFLLFIFFYRKKVKEVVFLRDGCVTFSWTFTKCQVIGELLKKNPVCCPLLLMASSPRESSAGRTGIHIDPLCD